MVWAITVLIQFGFFKETFCCVSITYYLIPILTWVHCLTVAPVQHTHYLIHGQTDFVMGASWDMDSMRACRGRIAVQLPEVRKMQIICALCDVSELAG